MSFKSALFMLSMLLFLGCSRVHQVTYLSDPPAAIIYCDGKRVGYAPTTVRYKLTDSQKEVTLDECDAKWVSGATAHIKERTLPVGSRINSDSKYLFKRPNYPDLERDETFALEQKKSRSIEEANQAIIDAQERRYRYYDDLYFYGDVGYYDGGYYGGGDVARMGVEH